MKTLFTTERLHKFVIKIILAESLASSISSQKCWKEVFSLLEFISQMAFENFWSLGMNRRNLFCNVLMPFSWQWWISLYASGCKIFVSNRNCKIRKIWSRPPRAFSLVCGTEWDWFNFLYTFSFLRQYQNWDWSINFGSFFDNFYFSLGIENYNVVRFWLWKIRIYF